MDPIAINNSAPVIDVAPARNDPDMNKCPRCLRWTREDGPEWPCTDGSRGEVAGMICWRCQQVLVLDYPDNPATATVIEWRTAHFLPVG